MNFICKIFGHNLPDTVTPVYAFTGKWKDEHGNAICYRCRICRRCKKRTPATPEDEIEKAKKTAEISAVMNGSRAQYGLKPIDWDD